MVRKRIVCYAHLMRLEKPIGTLLLLWPTLWGLWFAARGLPPLGILMTFILGVVVMRSAGCVFNDITDRHLDGHVTRTKNRPLVTQQVSVPEALILFFLLSFLALLCALYLNPFSWMMAAIGIILTVIYPFMKRITFWPQCILGFAFSWGVLMAYTAVQNQLSLEAMALFFISYVWTVSYDTIYAMVDRQDDLKAGIKSTAIKLGSYDVIFVTALHILVLLALLVFALALNLNTRFFIPYSLAALFVYYQTKLIYRRDPADCFKAFLNNHWFGALIFLAIAISMP